MDLWGSEDLMLDLVSILILGRQVVDKSYVVNLLRQKINDVNTELDKNRKESETISKDNSLYF